MQFLFVNAYFVGFFLFFLTNNAHYTHFYMEKMK